MKFFSSVFILISVTVCVAELKLEATDGENVTISFKTAELERADRVRITFTRENLIDLIAQYCRCAHCRDCFVVETPGVLLRVEEGTLILLNVSSESSGLYEAQVFNGNNVSKKTATLVVEPAFFSSRAPPQTSISKPPNSSERQRLYVLIAPVFILGVCFFCKCMRSKGNSYNTFKLSYFNTISELSTTTLLFFGWFFLYTLIDRCLVQSAGCDAAADNKPA